jgi:ATP-binding cassette subfamily C (CFTR/MRP) protein 1
VDKETDKVIQKVLRTRFEDRTVLTIAHRLNTIIDCDKIIVMDQGRVAEYGTVDELLSLSDGKFRSMALESGLISQSGELNASVLSPK